MRKDIREKPHWLKKDEMGRKNGRHYTVYLLDGNRYVGEWLDDKQHGILFLAAH
jgi:hypothetical protein